MVRARLERLLLAASLGLAGCCDFSEYSLFRRNACCEGGCASCFVGEGGCCEGPCLEQSCPQSCPAVVPPMVGGIVTPPYVPQQPQQYSTVPPLTPAPRLVPQPLATPAPYAPQSYR